MNVIDLKTLLDIIKKSVSDQNSQVPTILITSDTKFIVDKIRSAFTSCYSVCGHPQDESKSYYYLKPAECDIYYYCFTHFNEFGDLQYAIDIATKGHKPSFIILDNNSEYQYFPKDILEKYTVYSIEKPINKLLQEFKDSPYGTLSSDFPSYVLDNISAHWNELLSDVRKQKLSTWYNNQGFKLENELKKPTERKQYVLPQLPVRYVSFDSISKEDKLVILKEQLVIGAAWAILETRKNPQPIIEPLLKFFDIDTYVCPNQELYLRECLKETKGFEMLSIYHQLISILIEKCSHSRSRKYVDELEQLLVDTYKSVKVEESKAEDSIILLLDIATRIKNLKNADVEGYAGYYVKGAKELSVVSEVSADLIKQIEEMAKPYIEEENEFMMNDLNLDSIEYSDELKSNIIIP